MSVENISVDKFIESNASNLLPVDGSYSGYEWEKVTSSTSPADWLGGVRAEFRLPRYDNSVWDTSSMYIDCVAEITVKDNTPQSTAPHPAQHYNPMPTTAYSNVALEQAFTSGLVEDTEVNYGGIDLQNLQSPSRTYPYLLAAYTLINNEGLHTGGSAKCSSLPAMPIVAPITVANSDLFTYMNALLTCEHTTRREDLIYKDADDPFDLCIDQDPQKGIPVALSQSSMFRSKNFRAFASDIEATSADDYIGTNSVALGSIRSSLSSGYMYRNAAVRNVAPYPEVNQPIPTILYNDEVKGNKTRFLFKLKDPFLNSPYKKPANIELRVSLTRNRNIAYALCGEALFDEVLSQMTTTGSTLQAYNADATYQIIFNRMDMYCKRQFMTQNQLSVFKSSNLLTYDVPRYSIQTFSLNGQTSVNENINFTKAPQAVWISIVPDNNLNGYAGNPAKNGPGFVKYNSAYSSSDRDFFDFSELAINTAVGQIPKERYQLRDTVAGLHYNAGIQRAYKDFINTLKAPDKSISFQQWFENMRIYGFTINSNGDNVHFENSYPARSTINVVGEIYSDGTSQLAHTMVVIGMYYARVGVADHKSVFVTT